MNWYGSRSHERFIYRRVTFPTMKDSDDLGFITSGKIEDSYFADISSTGSVDFKGKDPLNVNDLIRIYYQFTDNNGEVYEYPLITGIITKSDLSYTGSYVEGTANIFGMTKALADDGFGRPMKFTSGYLSPVYYIRNIMYMTNMPFADGAGQNPTLPSGSGTWSVESKADESFLKVINALCSSAGFGAAYTDPWGTIQVQKYIEPNKRTPTWVFEDNEISTFKPTVKRSTNLNDIPNVVQAWYESETMGLSATATNGDRFSPASINQRGRQVVEHLDVDKLEGTTQNDMLENLKAKARKKLLDNSTEIIYHEVESLYVPVFTGDAVRLSYKAAGIDVVGAVTTRSITCELGAPTTYKIRTLLRPDFDVSVTGEVVWSGSSS